MYLRDIYHAKIVRKTILKKDVYENIQPHSPSLPVILWTYLDVYKDDRTLYKYKSVIQRTDIACNSVYLDQ